MCDWLHVEGSSKEHPRTLTSMSNLAMLLQAQGKLAEAEPLLPEALPRLRRSLSASSVSRWGGRVRGMAHVSFGARIVLRLSG